MPKDAVTTEDLERFPPDPRPRALQTEGNPGAPPAPEVPPEPNPGLKAEMDALKAHVDELSRGNKAKDKALEDAKVRLAEREAEVGKLKELSVAPQVSASNMEDVVMEKAQQLIEEQVARIMDGKMASATSALRRIEESERAAAKSAVLSKYGQETYDQYGAAAEELAKAKNLTLMQAMRLALPEGHKVQTAPATSVESGSPPAPKPEPTHIDRYREGLKKLNDLRKSNPYQFRQAAKAVLEDAIPDTLAMVRGGGGWAEGRG